ncbi:Dihydroorotase [Candidatus Roizmanbacteria bacterium]|nr:Dihydroorotase [Candidatus Roizmanbacteria bacterium]
MIKLPGLIDIHVHLRDPGQTEKEDFFTGTTAALAGGFTTILDMPNNKVPIISLERLKEKIDIAKKKAVCDIGFYAGSLGDNLKELMEIEPYVFGLKLYLNKTTGNFLIDENKLSKIFSAWKSDKPILVHAETDIIEKVIKQVSKTGKRAHICHVSTIYELKSIIKAKKQLLPITCGVTPHHLFLTRKDADELGSFGLMKPEIEKNYKEFLWKNLNYVDVIESDHAPHTIEEKNSGKIPFGVPGLETTLPLLLTAISEKKLSINRLIELCFENPRKIFNIKTDKNTYVEIDEKEEYIIDNKKLFTKCGWSPFAGWKVKGRVKKVYIRGKKVFENGKLLVKPGFGEVIEPL